MRSFIPIAALLVLSSSIVTASSGNEGVRQCSDGYYQDGYCQPKDPKDYDLGHEFPKKRPTPHHGHGGVHGGSHGRGHGGDSRDDQVDEGNDIDIDIDNDNDQDKDVDNDVDNDRDVDHDGGN